MASHVSKTLLRSRLSSRLSHLCPACRRYASTDSPAPALLLKLRTDLKTAMREKDSNRLNVLRGLLAEVTNAAKTNSPIKTDMQLLSLLRKKASAAKAAGDEFRQAGRDDLVEREADQAKVLEEYAGSVETMSGEAIRGIVTNVIAELRSQQGSKLNAGDVLKKLLAPGGSLDGKPVERSEVARIAKDALSQG